MTFRLVWERFQLFLILMRYLFVERIKVVGRQLNVIYGFFSLFVETSFETIHKISVFFIRYRYLYGTYFCVEISTMYKYLSVVLNIFIETYETVKFFISYPSLFEMVYLKRIMRRRKKREIHGSVGKIEYYLLQSAVKKFLFDSNRYRPRKQNNSTHNLSIDCLFYILFYFYSAAANIE